VKSTQIHKSRRGEAYELTGERAKVQRRVERLIDRLSTYGRVSVELLCLEPYTVRVGCLYLDGE
jgi:hypothetical protein